MTSVQYGHSYTAYLQLSFDIDSIYRLLIHLDLEATYRTFSYRGAHIWNYISKNVPTDVSYVCFINLVKTHIHVLALSNQHFRLNI